MFGLWEDDYGLTYKSTIFQSCLGGATARWVVTSIMGSLLTDSTEGLRCGDVSS